MEVYLLGYTPFRTCYPVSVKIEWALLLQVTTSHTLPTAPSALPEYGIISFTPTPGYPTTPGICVYLPDIKSSTCTATPMNPPAIFTPNRLPFPPRNIWIWLDLCLPLAHQLPHLSIPSLSYHCRPPLQRRIYPAYLSQSTVFDELLIGSDKTTCTYVMHARRITGLHRGSR